MAQPTESQEEKEKLIIPASSDAGEKIKTNQVGFVEEDSTATKAALGAGPWGAMADHNSEKSTKKLVLKQSRAIITGGASHYKDNLKLYNQREFEEFDDNESMDGDLEESDVRIGETSKEMMTT